MRRHQAFALAPVIRAFALASVIVCSQCNGSKKCTCPYFEDCFKRLNADLKRQADAVLSKSNRATQFDILKCIRQDTLSNGLEHAISSVRP